MPRNRPGKACTYLLPVCLLILFFIVTHCAPATAQAYAGCAQNGHTVDDSACLGSPSSGSSGYSTGCNVLCQGMRDVFSALTDPFPNDRRARAANEEGIALANQGRWNEAAERFRLALAIDGEDVIIEANYYQVLANAAVLAGQDELALANARRALGYAQYSEERRRDIMDLINPIQARLAAREQQESTARKQAEFAGMHQQLTSQIRSIENTTIAKTGTPFFGAPANSSSPDVGGTPARTIATQKSTADQLRFADASSTVARNASRGEASKDFSGCSFDTGACVRPLMPAITTPRIGGGERPVVAALKSTIPEGGRKLSAIKNAIGWFAKLEDQKAQDQERLVAIDKKLSAGFGDPAVLKAERATVANSLAGIDRDQQTAKDAIQKQLVSHHMDFVEEDKSLSTTATK